MFFFSLPSLSLSFPHSLVFSLSPSLSLSVFLRNSFGKMTKGGRAIGVTGNSRSARRKVLCCWGNAAKRTRARSLSERADESFLRRSILPFTRPPSVTPYPGFLLKLLTTESTGSIGHDSFTRTENREFLPKCYQSMLLDFSEILTKIVLVAKSRLLIVEQVIEQRVIWNEGVAFFYELRESLFVYFSLRETTDGRNFSIFFLSRLWNKYIA